MNTEKLITDFKNPPVEFRGVPFWSWNSKLSPERLREQIRIMKKMGMGGFFMHSRVGLNTSYLGDEWFDCVHACIDEAKKEGVAAWLYDEDRWPSGAAGGIVTADDRFKMKELLMEKTRDKSTLSAQGTTLVCFAAVFEGEKVVSYRRTELEDELADNETFIRCYFDFSQKSSDFNGETYLDTLNDEAVRKFIEVTHEAYYQKFKDEFGKAVPGIFTDEPCYALPFRGDVNLPWTAGFEEKFRKKYGYDLLDGMIELYFDCGNEVSLFRYDYYDLLTELFVNAFSKQIGEWCANHNVLLTGHILWEDELDGHTAYIGNAMRFYEYMQIPGIDLLTEHWLTFATAKQCTSIARQLGKKRRLTELYGCTGWDFPLFAHKALGDWQYAMGINFRCHHLYWYSMEAEAKRDYPASISEHSPWYAAYSKVEDHFARVGSMLSGGNEIRDILVIHPIESAWSTQYRVSNGKVPAVADLNQQFIALANLLLSENLDFDYGEEELLSRYAEIKGGMFTVGEAEYKAVVVPELKTIRKKTLNLLEKFAAAGGKVYYLNNAPQYVNAEKSDTAENVFKKFTEVNFEKLVEYLGNTCRRISISTPDGKEIAPLIYHLSETGDRMTLFVCNTGTELSDNYMTQDMVRNRKLSFPQVSVAITASGGKFPYEFNTIDGTVHEIPYHYEDGRYIFDTFFDELQSRLFVLSSEKMPNTSMLNKTPLPSCIQKLDDVKCTVLRDEPNVFILDHADISINNVCVKENMFILHADDFIRKELDKPARGGHMVQPYLQKKETPSKILDLQLKYTFSCQEIPQTKCHLAIEHPEFYNITFNGKKLENIPEDYWIDPVLQLIEVPCDMFERGINQLTLSCRYHEKLPGLESLFILGEFGVFDNAITSLDEFIKWGDWCTQGFSAYGGNLTYKFTLPEIREKDCSINIPEWRGAALGIKINDSEPQILICPPYKVELTDKLKYDGNDSIEICVYGHRRNVFGPFYSLNKWPSWTGPDQFKIYETTKRQTVPCGILAAPYIEIIKKGNKKCC